MEILKQDDPESTAAEAGEYLNNWLIENKKQPVLLMLSSGSALAILEYVGQTALGANLTISVLDERFSQDPTINNFAQLEKTDFFTDALNADSSFFGTLPRNEETSQQLAERWEKNLRNWREENPRGLIAATLGMGPDGHTAGILPFAEAPDEFEKLFNKENWVTAYNGGNKSKYPERITATVTLLKLIDVAFAFVVGEEKKEKFEELTAGKAKAAELPATIWHEMKKVIVFTDIK